MAQSSSSLLSSEKIVSGLNLRPPVPLSFEGDISKNYKTWIRQVELYMKANECENRSDETKVAILLSLLGEEGLDKYETFDLSETEKNNYDKVKKSLEEYCIPKTNESINRHMFFQRQQKEGENFDCYLVELKKLASVCNFESLKDSLLKDRIIAGMRCPKLKDRLLREDNLNLEKCIQMCKSAELMESHLEKLSIEDISTTNINRINKNNTKFFNKKPVENKMDYSGGQKYKCYKCGYEHGPRRCPAYNKTCSYCNRLHHFAQVCKNKKQLSVREVQENEAEAEEYMLGAIDMCNENWTVKVFFPNYNKDCSMKLDTGAGCNVISVTTIEKLGILEQIEYSQTILRNYNNSKIDLLGTINLLCEINNQKNKLKFHVVNCNSIPLIGLPTIKKLNLIQPIHQIVKSDIVKLYPSLFLGIGEIKDYIYDFKLIPNYTGKVIPCRPVPMKLLEVYKKELEDMEKNKIIRKIDEPTDFVNAVVIVKKNDNSIRICLDPQYLNSCLLREHYKLPTFDEISAKMANAKVFSKLDCSKAFYQIKLSDTSSKLTTFQTPFGRYCFLRMPYGVKVASEVYHKQFCRLFEGVPNVEIFIDDLIIWAENQQKHDEILNIVIKKALEHNITFNAKKCIINTNYLKFLGHIFTDKGILMDDDKIENIVKMEKPKDVVGIQKLLGVITYVSKFIPNVAELTSPLRLLLKKDKDWVWGVQQENSFIKIKDYLIKSPILQYYNPNLPCLLSVDASSNGVGAVLLQKGLPVAYASRAFTETQKAWAQIEKEMYSIVFACEKFHFYIMGRKIAIENDHKPLIPIMKKALAEIPIRLQKMRLRLQHYDIDLTYKPGKFLHMADYLSRNYLKQKIEEDEDFDCSILLVELKENMSEKRYEEFKKETRLDEELNLVKKYIFKGWPENCNELPNNLKQYHTFHTDLYIIDDLVFKNNCLVVPKKLQKEMLSKLHYNHLGIEKTKTRAREILFWVGMSKQIEEFIRNCSTCIKFSKSNAKEPLIPHQIPIKPWDKLRVDIFHLYSKDYILIIDYFSKYVEIMALKSLTTECVITSLKQCFSRFGIPSELHSDGGPQFKSSNFKEFSTSWDFKHILSSAYYPRSNGMVERHIQTLKLLLKKCIEDKKDPYLALLEYRNTPIAHNIESPNKILLGYNVKGIFQGELNKSQNYSEIRNELLKRQINQKEYYDRNVKNLKELDLGEKIVLKNHQTNIFDKPGLIIGHSNKPRSYEVLLENGNVINRNRIDIKKNSNNYALTEKGERELEKVEQGIPTNDNIISSNTENLNNSTSENKETNDNNDNGLDIMLHKSADKQNITKQLPEKVSSRGRVIKTPKYLKDYNIK